MPTASRFRRKERLGGGGQGTVYVWNNTSTKERIAGKEVPPDPDGVYTALHEYEVVAKMPPHPHIVHMKGVQYLDEHNINVPYLCTEVLEGGNIEQYLRTKGPLPEEEVAQFALQILYGLQHSHQNDVVHRDIKPSNVLLCKQGGNIVKLADFGIARHADTISTGSVARGSLPYMAPELLRPEGKPSRGSDIWALGCTVLQLLTHVLPWSDVVPRTEILHDHILSKEGQEGHHPTIPDTLSVAAIDFLMQCFAPTAAGRGTCASLLGHPFVSSGKNLFSVKMVVVHEGNPVSLHYAAGDISRSIPEGFSPDSLLTLMVLHAPASMTSLPDEFYKNCRMLTAVEFSSWQHLRLIGNEFLAECTSLTNVDLSGSIVTKIGKSFLCKCTSLTTLELSCWTSVTEIGDYFFWKCTSLTTLDLSGWISVTEISDSFLWKCTSLTTADLSGWSSVTKIGDWFLRDCASLATVDLSGWSNVSQIGDSFLSNCTSLTTVDLSGWSSVTKIDGWFLRDCASLTTVDLSDLRNVTKIGDSFFWHCTSLTTVDFSEWSNVTEIGSFFLNGCSSLTTVDFSGWGSVTKIGWNSLCGCTSLTSVDLSAMKNLKKIPSLFLVGCTNLKTKKLPSHLAQESSCSVQ